MHSSASLFKVLLTFPLSKLYFLAAQRLAEFSNAFFQNVLQRRADELLASDIIVIGAPMYNLSIPAVLKAWIDQIVRPMRTFTFSPVYKGLATGKRAIFAIAAGGGGYAEGGPRQSDNHADPYLRKIFSFIGIEDIQFVHFYNTVNDRREQGEQLAHQEVHALTV
ncbi:MAG: NAD(P)H-dependent oxidoreductase [Planctomycetes bacterium]|nr:NAD(P)H-dependent oxidoreductase [Planctomycetota bacterium]